MDKYRLLNTTDEWEDLVNENAKHRSKARDRAMARVRELKVNKLWFATLGFALMAFVFALFSITGAMAEWLATTIAVVSLAQTGVLFGKFLEVTKR